MGTPPCSTYYMQIVGENQPILRRVLHAAQMEWVRQMNACKAQAEEIVKSTYFKKEPSLM